MTSSSGRSIATVARAIAAAVLRPFGSTISRRVRDLVPDELAVAAVGTQKMSTVAQQRGDARRTVRWIRVSSPSSGQEGLRALRPAQRPEPRAAAAGHDHGVHARPF